MFKMPDLVRPSLSGRRTNDSTGAQRSAPQFPQTTNWLSIFAAMFALMLLFFAGAARADVSENFDASTALPSTFTADGDYTVRTSSSYSSPNVVRIRNTASLTYIGEDGNGKDGGIGAISFWYRRTGLVNTTCYVEYSTDGGATYTEIAAPVATSQTYTQFSQIVNLDGDNILIRFRVSYSNVTYGVYVDDISITDNTVFNYSADASLNEDAHGFGLIAGDATSDTLLTISNGGAPVTESLVIDAAGMTFTGAGAGKFSVVGFSGATLAPGESTTMTLRYTPGNDGSAHTAVGTLSCNDPEPPSINLSGSNYAVTADLNAARALSVGSRVRVTGTVTATVATNGLTMGRNRFFVQDASGADGQTGLMIDDPDFNLGQTCALGEQLQNLTGVLSTVDGMTALVPSEPATDLGAGSVPAPLELGSGETFAGIEGELVTLSNVYFEESGTWASDQTVDIVSPPTGPLSQIYVAVGSGLIGETIPDIALPKHVIGIAALNGSTGQLMSRLASDVTAGEALDAAISIDDVSAIDFGECDINTGWKIGRRLQIHNSGAGPLTWTRSGVSFSGTDAAEFGAHPSIERLPVVWPGTTETLAVYMDADSIGTKTAQLVLSTNAVNEPGISIGVTGVGVESEEMTIGWEQYAGGPEHRGRRYFNGTVTRLDAPVWQTGPQGLMASAAPCVIEDEASTIPIRVYCWGTDDTGYDATYAFVKCFNGETGALIWTSTHITDIGYTIGFDSWHSMAADKRSNRVFVGMGDNVYCFDADTGVMCWESDPLRVDAGGMAIVVNATCVVGKDYVYQTTYTGFGGTNYVQAFNISNGKEAWFFADGGQGQETMVYREVGERAFLYRTNVDGYYPTGGGGLTCLDATSGTLVWDNSAPLEGDPWFTEQSNFGGISYCDGEIYSPTYNFGGISELICVDAATGRLKWRATDSVASDAVPVVIADRVFITGHYDWNTGPSYVIGYDRATGEKVYEVAVSDGNNMWNTCVSATNDMIYVTEGSCIYGMAANGLHILDPFREEELAEQGAAAERVRGSVAIGAEGSIYALMDTDPASGLAHLICYRAPVAGTLTIEDQDAPTTDGYTTNRDVTLLHDAQWADEMRVWEDGQTPGDWVAYAPSGTLTLSAGDGRKTVWAEYRNGSGEAGPVSANAWVGAPVAVASMVRVHDIDGDVPEGQTNERAVKVEIPCDGATEMMIRDDETTGSWQSYSPSTRFFLSPALGLRTLHIMLRNPAGETEEMDCTIEALPSPFAWMELLDSEGALVPSTHDAFCPLLGSPARQFKYASENRLVKIVEPPFGAGPDNEQLITSIRNNAHLTVQFDHLVLDDPANPYGIDLLVFGNAFYVGSGYVNNETNMNTYTLTGGIFAEEVTVSVSQDGVTWHTFDEGPFADGDFPTNAYIWDESNATWTDQLTDYTKPVDPALKETFATRGLTAAQVISQYDGSGGGTGYDIAQLGLDWIQYVRVSSNGGEIDAFSDVASTNTAITALSFDVRDMDGNMLTGQTDEHDVTVAVTALGAVEMMVWEEGTTASWQTYSSSTALTLSSEPGAKVVHVRLRDAAGQSTGLITKTIRLIGPTAVRNWQLYQ